ncbi:MAG: hypothetical protein U9M90_04415 [Patescibacteria group bacterium]|nr:hypothetical protein [Patescibacteria group bacterium]
MRKHVKIERIVNPRLEGSDVRVKKTGANSYQITTGKPEKHKFSRFSSRRDSFDRKFIEEYNRVAERDDYFDLGHRDTKDSLGGLREGLERGDSNFDLKVRE